VEAETHVVADREVREQRVVLEDEADTALFRGNCRARTVGDRAPGDRNLARVGGLEPSDKAKGGGLAAPGWAEQGEDAARRNAEREIVDRRSTVGHVSFAHGGQREKRHAQVTFWPMTRARDWLDTGDRRAILALKIVEC
jgi:hypothetical protein